jgi:hypothetical protein
MNQLGYASIDSRVFEKISSTVFLLRVCLFLRVIKMVKIMKLGRIIASVEELITSDDFMLVWTLSKILGQVVLIAHWFACLYWLIGSTE